jgi:S1-C subfamily serine protease
LGIAVRNLVPFDRYANRPTPLLIHCVLATLVAPNSPAARGELRPGDLITRVGDKPTPSVEALRNVLKALAGSTDPIPFMVQRGEDRKVLNIQLPRQ